MNSQLKKGVIEIAILNFLAKEELYGYQIVAKLEKHIKVKESSVYLILSRLLQNGYLDLRIEHHGKKQVKYYKVSAPGKEYLDLQLDNWDEIEKLIKESRNEK